MANLLMWLLAGFEFLWWSTTRPDIKLGSLPVEVVCKLEKCSL
jgi:hypothetical protein